MNLAQEGNKNNNSPVQLAEQKQMPLQQQKQTIVRHEQNKNAADINKTPQYGATKMLAQRKQRCSINNYDANAAASTTTVQMPWHQQL